jgi:TonB family protein
VIQVEPERLELSLLVETWDENRQERRRQAALGSLLTHALLILGLILLPKIAPPPRAEQPQQNRQHITLLYPPLQELTQTEPNRGPRSKLFLGEAQPPRPPKLFIPKNIPQPANLPGNQQNNRAQSDLAKVEPPQLVPKPELSGAAPLPQILPPSAPPPIPPKLTLENATSPPGGRQGQPQPGILAQERAGNIIEGAVRDLSRSAGRGGTVVGDGYSPGLPDGAVIPSPGNAGSNLELLSDPLGVDFRPYLTRILATVRRNWYAVIPESARLGMVRGRVAIQFIIVRPGIVSKLVIADASGHEALDRAAVAGISASNPFPPLPPEFHGNEIKLQFTFLYNIPVHN